jgi:hypothetical protein
MLSTSKGRVSPPQHVLPTKTRALYSDAVHNRLKSTTTSTVNVKPLMQQLQERVDSALLELNHQLMTSELATSGLVPTNDLRSLAMDVLLHDQDGGSEHTSDIDAKTPYCPSTSLSDYSDYIHGGGLVQSGPVYDEELDEYVPCQFPIWPRRSTSRTTFIVSTPLPKPKSLVKGLELKFDIASIGEVQADWADYECQKTEKDEIMKGHLHTITAGIKNGDYSLLDIPDILKYEDFHQRPGFLRIVNVCYSPTGIQRHRGILWAQGSTRFPTSLHLLPANPLVGIEGIDPGVLTLSTELILSTLQPLIDSIVAGTTLQKASYFLFI